MNVLVTGSAGKLGSATVKYFKEIGIDVTGVDIIESPTTDKLLDINNKHSVDNTIKGFDAIIHTAAVHGRHYELNYPRQAFIDTNIQGTLNLLEACVKNKVNRFLYISTTSIYGNAMVDDEKAVWVDESLVTQPRDIYDITKQTAENLCRDFFYKEGLQTSVYRVGRFLPEVDNLALNHRLYRGLDERDGAAALALAVKFNLKQFEIFNISSGSPFSRNDVFKLKTNPAEVILQYYPNAAAIYERNGWSFPESIDRVYDSSKAKNLLGYQPKYTFEQMLCG